MLGRHIHGKKTYHITRKECDVAVVTNPRLDVVRPHERLILGDRTIYQPRALNRVLQHLQRGGLRGVRDFVEQFYPIRDIGLAEV